MPGSITVTFRNRWWHFYERGVSWAEGGLDIQAEADFRQCLRLRQSDSRLARTYGMHFVQCFAHRELGAVLLRRGDLDGAERELRLSQDQEPSAKAEYLLERLAQLRGTPAAARPGPDAGTSGRGIELTSAVPTQTLMHVVGRLLGDTGAALWSVDPAGQAIRLPTDSAGAFHGDVALEATLSLGTEAGPDRESAPPVAVAQPQEPAVTLSLDGPDHGGVVSDGQAWYRWQATAAASLARLEVHDDHGTPLADLPLNGVRSAGTLRLDLASGVQVLRFRLTDRAGAETLAERQIEARPSPQQDRRLRAVALVIPLQAPRPGGVRPSDDPRLRSALLENGRFRFLDAQADELLTRELGLVEAGYVDRATAAAAGQRLAARYVITGTMSRGERDAECFLRLVHCDSGQVVAVADAYAEIAASTEADRLFAATAGRLRQVFPIVAGGLTRLGEDRVRFDCGSLAGAVALMRVHVFATVPAAGAEPNASIELETVDDLGAEAHGSGGSLPDQGWGVSE